jgi:hypothetical protein
MAQMTLFFGFVVVVYFIVQFESKKRRGRNPASGFRFRFRECPEALALWRAKSRSIWRHAQIVAATHSNSQETKVFQPGMSKALDL